MQQKKVRFNAIDAVVLVVILVAAAFAVYRFMLPNVTTSESSTYVITYYGDEVPEFSAGVIEVGDSVSDEQKNSTLGVVTDVKLGPSDSYAANSAGEFVKGPKEGYNSIYLTTEVQGNDYEHGVVVASSKYGVGHSLTLRVGKGKIWVRIYDIQKKD
ncbi:MAG: DUF4330 family protein [Clostridia bacterium]|nr:DUF4330 family protein [Clostridia bacterium]